MKTWNWQKKDWPHFTWDASRLAEASETFLKSAGVLIGADKALRDGDREELIVEVTTGEALQTSEIEGEILNRDSVRVSILKQFGFIDSKAFIPPAEQGIGALMYELYKNYEEELSHESLFKWHELVMLGNSNIKDIGTYRTHEDEMQVISYKHNTVKVHYVAPPSSTVRKEMETFIEWFNDSLTDKDITPIERAAVAHHHFVMIHPFEDGNGRMGRAVALKALSQSLDRPQIISLSSVINQRRKEYYEALEITNKKNEIDEWMTYFTEVLLEAQETTMELLDFIIEKTKFYDRFRDELNERQGLVIERIFREGPKGFDGGLSAENYIRITKAPRTTVTRDLNDLVKKGIMTKTGRLKGTRYSLNL